MRDGQSILDGERSAQAHAHRTQGRRLLGGGPHRARRRGGGETSLDNFQTLCVPCHQKKTRQQAADKHKRSLAEAAEGTADLREWFARPREDGAVGISERESNDVLL